MNPGDWIRIKSLDEFLDMGYVRRFDYPNTTLYFTLHDPQDSYGLSAISWSCVKNHLNTVQKISSIIEDRIFTGDNDSFGAVFWYANEIVLLPDEEQEMLNLIYG